MIFGIYPCTSHTSKFWKMYMITCSNFMMIIKPWCTSPEEFKYFSKWQPTYENCFLPKIHKRLFDVTGRPVISICGKPTEKMSECFDYQLKSIAHSARSYIRDYKFKVQLSGLSLLFNAHVFLWIGWRQSFLGNILTIHSLLGLMGRMNFIRFLNV